MSTLPIPVKVCSYCYSQHHIETNGFNSVRIDAWFCHKYCHNLALLMMGETKHPDNPEYCAHLFASKKKIFPERRENVNGETFTVSPIIKNKQRLREDKRCGKIKIVKNVFNNEYQENF